MKILFVCLGNICRSPIGHGILENLIQDNHLNIYVDSAGTSAYHVGEAPDTRSIKVCAKYGVDIKNQKSRQVSIDDFRDFDVIFAMDKSNYQSLMNMKPETLNTRIYKLRDYDELKPGADVPDPYYGGEQGFNDCFAMIERSVTSFLNKENLLK